MASLALRSFARLICSCPSSSSLLSFPSKGSETEVKKKKKCACESNYNAVKVCLVKLHSYFVNC